METELDAALIDAFDAEPTTVGRPLVDAMASALRVPPPPMVSRPLRHAETSHDPFPTPPSTGFLRHYPSLDALQDTTINRAAPKPPPSRSQQSPSLDSVPRSVAEGPVLAYPSFGGAPATHQKQRVEETSQSAPTQPKESSLPRHTGPSPAAASTLNTASSPPEVPQLNMPQPRRPPTPQPGSHDVSEDPQNEQLLPSEQEIEHQRRVLQAQLDKFQAQTDYLALALAGETPHQIAARKQREEERKERDERRLHAIETRTEHIVEREHQREARDEERRQRFHERAHRSSQESSPERGISSINTTDNTPEEEQGDSSSINTGTVLQN